MKFDSLIVPALGKNALIDVPNEYFDVKWFLQVWKEDYAKIIQKK
jgi:hypothetical protein